MKKTAIVSTVLCLSLLAAGCTDSQPSQTSEPTTTTTTNTTTTTTTTTTSETSEAVTSEEATSEATKPAHDVKVEIITLLSSKEGDYEFKSVVPKLTVDGKEATEINKSIKSYIQKEYPLEMEGEYANGMSTELAWGVKDNIVSIIIHGSDTGSDYWTYDVVNYDLDTQKAADDSAVLSAFGMTGDDFLSKTSDIVKDFCKDDSYDLDKSLAAVNFDGCTPFVMPDGSLGVAAGLIYGSDGQFGGLTGIRCFNLATKELYFIEG